MHLKLPSIRLPDRERRISFFVEAASYRVARPVTKLVRYPMQGYCYPLCPRCKKCMEREYISYCDRCGQKLTWDKIVNAKILTAPIID